MTSLEAKAIIEKAEADVKVAESTYATPEKQATTRLVNIVLAVLILSGIGFVAVPTADQAKIFIAALIIIGGVHVITEVALKFHKRPRSR